MKQKMKFPFPSCSFRLSRYKLDAKQELFAFGFAQFCGAFFQAIPIQGSLSRSALNAQNARTQLSNLISFCCLTVALMYLMPLLYYLPKTCLAAIIIMAASKLLDFEKAMQLYQVRVHGYTRWCDSVR